MYTMDDFDSDPEQGGEVRAAPSTNSRRDGVERRLDLARQMVAHMQANQHPSYKVTGRVWSKGGFVRVYTSVGSYAEIKHDPEDGLNYYEHVGVDRGSRRALKDAWDAAE